MCDINDITLLYTPTNITHKRKHDIHHHIHNKRQKSQESQEFMFYAPIPTPPITTSLVALIIMRSWTISTTSPWLWEFTLHTRACMMGNDICHDVTLLFTSTTSRAWAPILQVGMRIHCYGNVDAIGVM